MLDGEGFKRKRAKVATARSGIYFADYVAEEVVKNAIEAALNFSLWSVNAWLP
jgi:hypothetical protein